MKNMGDGRRVARVEKEVQQTIAQFLISGLKVRLPGLVTVASVKMPADLRTAKVYISVLGTEKGQPEEVVESLQAQASHIQKYIGDQLRMRYCPKLSFYVDHATDQILKVERILHDLEEERQSRKASTEDDSSEDD